MKIVTANRLASGRVVYAGADNQPVDRIDQAAVLDDAGAEAAVAALTAQPEIYVGVYAVEVQDRTPSGRDRLKERIRSAGPTVGHSLNRSLAAASGRENA